MMPKQRRLQAVRFSGYANPRAMGPGIDQIERTPAGHAVVEAERGVRVPSDFFIMRGRYFSNAASTSSMLFPL